MTKTMTTAEYGRQMDAIVCALGVLKDVLDAVGEVDDVVGRPGEPCPAASQLAIGKIRRLLAAYQDSVCDGKAEPDEPDEPPERAVCALPSVGPAPYKAELVHARNGALFAEVPGRHATEEVAVEAVLVAASAHGAQVDYGCIRHWLTNKREHIVDFGSHGMYGRITSVKEGE